MIAGRWMITGRRENIIRGFMKCGYPSSWMVISWTIHLLKWMIQGDPYFRKPPRASKCQETIPKASLCGLILSHCWTYEKHVIPHVPTIHLVLRSTQLEKKTTTTGLIQSKQVCGQSTKNMLKKRKAMKTKEPILRILGRSIAAIVVPQDEVSWMVNSPMQNQGFAK